MKIASLVVACAAALMPSSAHAETISGESSGALWQIEVPDSWNGDVIVYAHGIEEPDAELEINPDSFPFEAFAAQGYAVITTSYSSTGWAVKDAYKDVHKLHAIFKREVGKPDHTYILGASLGGLVASQQSEKLSTNYDGALLYCPAVAGLADSSEYFAEVTALFDVFYPGVLGFDPAEPPVAGTFDVDTMLYNAQIAILTDPTGAFQILSVMGGDVPGSDTLEYVESILTALGFWATYAEESNDRAGGWSFDTTGTVYAGSADDAALNATVSRLSGANSAANYADHWYQPDGDLHIPTLLITTLEDPVLPAAGPEGYADLVDSQVASDLLTVQTVDRYGHCSFSPTEIFTAFSDLVLWVEYGVTPPSGDVTSL